MESIIFYFLAEESIEIRDCLNFFFPFYVKHCSWSLPLFENAILSAMDTLFNAPINNPLSIVDQKCVLKVLSNLTSSSFVHEKVFMVNVSYTFRLADVIIFSV